jgi:hypothetical protein
MSFVGERDDETVDVLVKAEDVPEAKSYLAQWGAAPLCTWYFGELAIMSIANLTDAIAIKLAFGV